MKKEEKLHQKYNFVSASCGGDVQQEITAIKKETQEALDSLEADGLLRKTGELRRGKTGDLQPIYVPTTVSDWLEETGLINDFNQYLTKKEVQQAFDSLEREGLICKTGEFRQGSNGELQPVYVATPFLRKN